MPQNPPSAVVRQDEGTARLFGDGNAVFNIATGGFTSGMLIIEMDDRAPAITMTPTLSRGAMVGAAGAYVGTAYTPPGGAFAAFSADGVQTRRVELVGDVLQVTLAFAGGSGSCTSRVSLVGKQGYIA